MRPFKSQRSASARIGSIEVRQSTRAESDRRYASYERQAEGTRKGRHDERSLDPNRTRVAVTLAFLCVFGVLTRRGIEAQEPRAAAGEWRYIGGERFHTRYLPVDQINAATSRSPGRLGVAR